MDKDKLSFFSSCFESSEIKDADIFENNAVDFRNWFVSFDFREIQKEFDILFPITKKIATHYRPKVQSSGCDCLFIIVKESAPAQISRIRLDLHAIFDKLIQVGHSDVVPSLMPCITERIEIIYKNPSDSTFHDMVSHLMETWTRDSTSAAASFVISTEFQKIIRYMGLSSSRYIELIIDIVYSRAKNTKSRNHLLQFTFCISELVKQSWPVIRSVKAKIEQFIEKTLETVENHESINLECIEIRKLIDCSPVPPTL